MAQAEREMEVDFSFFHVVMPDKAEFQAWLFLDSLLTRNPQNP